MPLVAPVILPEMYKIFTMAEVLLYLLMCSLSLSVLRLCGCRHTFYSCQSEQSCFLWLPLMIVHCICVIHQHGSPPWTVFTVAGLQYSYSLQSSGDIHHLCQPDLCYWRAWKGEAGSAKVSVLSWWPFKKASTHASLLHLHGSVRYSPESLLLCFLIIVLFDLCVGCSQSVDLPCGAAIHRSVCPSPADARWAHVW